MVGRAHWPLPGVQTPSAVFAVVVDQMHRRTGEVEVVEREDDRNPEQRRNLRQIEGVPYQVPDVRQLEAVPHHDVEYDGPVVRPSVLRYLDVAPQAPLFQEFQAVWPLLEELELSHVRDQQVRRVFVRDAAHPGLRW